MKMSNALISAILVGMTMFSVEKGYADANITHVYYVGNHDIYYDDGPAYIVYRPAIYEPFLYVGLHIVFGDPFWYFPRVVWHPRPIRTVYYYPGHHPGHPKHHYYKYSYVTGYCAPVVYSYNPPYHRAAYNHRSYNDPLPQRKRDWHRRSTPTASRQRRSYSTHTATSTDYSSRKRSTAVVRQGNATPASYTNNRSRKRSTVAVKHSSTRPTSYTKNITGPARGRVKSPAVKKNKVERRPENTRITARKSPEVRSGVTVRRNDNTSRRDMALKDRERRQEKAAGGAAFKKPGRKPVTDKSVRQGRDSRTHERNRGVRKSAGKGRKSATRR